MPVLTKDQVVEAMFELLPNEREEVVERVADNDGGFELSEEQKNETRRRIADHRRGPSKALTREQLMASLRGTG